MTLRTIPRRPGRFVTQAAVALALLVACHTAAAQTATGPMPPPRNQPAPAQERAPIRVQVEVVSTPVVVHDSKGQLVLDLSRRDFRVFDNGLEQRLEEDGFDLGGAPLSVVIVVETSSRIEALLPAIRRTGILFTQTVLGGTGEAAIIGCHDQVTRLLDFTSDHEAVERTFSFGLNRGTSGVRLYDGLSQAVRLLQDRPRDRRRVIIALTEAADTGSEERLGDVLRDAQLANVTIYTVGLSTTVAEMRSPQTTSGPSISPPGTIPARPGSVQTPTTEAQSSGSADLLALALWVIQHASEPFRENALELAAAATGGSHQAPVRDRSIETAIDQIGGELHAQYTLSYRPSGTEAGYHEIRVVVDRAGTQVRARPGYYLAGSVN